MQRIAFYIIGLIYRFLIGDFREYTIKEILNDFEYNKDLGFEKVFILGFFILFICGLVIILKNILFK